MPFNVGEEGCDDIVTHTVQINHMLQIVKKTFILDFILFMFGEVLKLVNYFSSEGPLRVPWDFIFFSFLNPTPKYSFIKFGPLRP